MINVTFKTNLISYAMSWPMNMNYVPYVNLYKKKEKKMNILADCNDTKYEFRM